MLIVCPLVVKVIWQQVKVLTVSDSISESIHLQYSQSSYCAVGCYTRSWGHRMNKTEKNTCPHVTVLWYAKQKMNKYPHEICPALAK